MACPACLVALMGTESEEPTVGKTQYLLAAAVAAVGLYLIWRSR